MKNSLAFSNPARVWFVLAALPLLGALAAKAYLGWFARLYADDYCMAWVIRSMGLWDSLIFWYKTWSGRYMFTFFTGVFTQAQHPLAMVLPALILATWLAALFWMCYVIITAILKQTTAKVNPAWLALLMAVALLFLTLELAPNLFQVLYWETGMVNYMLPLIFFCVQVALLLRLRRGESAALKIAGLLSVGGLAFLAVGFAEVYSALQITAYSLALGILFLATKVPVFQSEKTWRGFVVPLVVGLGMSILGFALVAVAPGNQARVAANAAEGIQGVNNILDLVILSARNALYMGLYYGANFRWHFVLFGLLALGLGWALESSGKALPAKQDATHSRRQIKHPLRSIALKNGLFLILLPLSCFALIMAAHAPAVYTLAASLEPRSELAPLFVMVLTIILEAACLGALLRKLVPRAPGYVIKGVAVFILACLVIVSFQSGQKTLQQAPAYRQYAAAWDARDQQLRQEALAGELNLTAVGLDAIAGLQDLRVEPTFWVNSCMARYYGVESITGR